MRALQIGWKVPTLTASVASVRYRALLPMLALESVQAQSRLFAAGLESNLDGLDALVIVKSFGPDDLFLAQHAARKGIRVVFDLCDNIFIDGYAGRAGKAAPAQIFDAIAAVADVIVVTTEPLAQVVRERVTRASVCVIPDGIETPALQKDMEALLRQATAFEKSQRQRVLRLKVRNMLVRLREEGPGLAVRLALRVVHRGQRGVRTRIRRWQDQLATRRSHAPSRPAPLGALTAPKGASPAAAGPSTAPPRRAKVIVWFGNHGAPHARFGMLDLLEIRQPLETVAQAFDVELVVISNHREKYETHIKPLRIPSRYVEWSPKAVSHWLREADVVVVPNTLDPFSLCKSANRTVLAVSHGAPVVATPTPALAPLAPHVHLGDALAGLQRYLGDREAGRADARAADALAQAAFGQEAIAQAWLQVLSRTPVAARNDDAVECLIALNMVQDLDLAVPVFAAWEAAGLQAQAWCSAGLIHKSPRVLATLAARGISYRVLPDELPTGSFSFPAAARALLTLAETNLGPHRFSRRLTELAMARGLTVATLQHGFENVGLTYEDAVHSLDRVNIKAERIYIWGGLDTLHPRLDAAVRQRCVSMGIPKPAHGERADLDGLLPLDRPIVGIFENLHWHRYDDDYRQAFLDSVKLLAERFPQLTFLVKPHHAGMWLTQRYDGQRPAAANLVIADPQAPQWESHTASGLLGHLSAVITSPSTVALDAARCGLPVAVFAGVMSLPSYAPLPLLRAPADAAYFVADALDAAQRGRFERASADFVARVLAPGDGAQRIAADLAAVSRTDKSHA